MTPTTTTPTTPAMRFEGLAGALVAVYPATPDYFRWVCEGCGAHDGPITETAARTSANDHASTCRALPRT